jgi:hypothetical protein
MSGCVLLVEHFKQSEFGDRTPEICSVVLERDSLVLGLGPGRQCNSGSKLLVADTTSACTDFRGKGCLSW